MPNWLAGIEIIAGWAVGIGVIALIFWLKRRKDSAGDKPTKS